jgi:hypothetical protein
MSPWKNVKLFYTTMAQKMKTPQLATCQHVKYHWTRIFNMLMCGENITATLILKMLTVLALFRTSRWRLVQEDKRMAFEYTHGLFIT